MGDNKAKKAGFNAGISMVNLRKTGKILIAFIAILSKNIMKTVLAVVIISLILFLHNYFFGNIHWGFGFGLGVDPGDKFVGNWIFVREHSQGHMSTAFSGKMLTEIHLHEDKAGTLIFDDGSESSIRWHVNDHPHHNQRTATVSGSRGIHSMRINHNVGNRLRLSGQVPVVSSFAVHRGEEEVLFWEGQFRRVR